MVNSKLKRKKRESLPVVYWHDVKSASELWRQLHDLRSAYGRDIVAHVIVRSHGVYLQGSESSDSGDVAPTPITHIRELSRHSSPEVDDEVLSLRSYTG